MTRPRSRPPTSWRRTCSWASTKCLSWAGPHDECLAEPRSAQPLRLPGSVAEVEASPEGPRIGAFFDLDGTLVAGFTVAAVTKDRLRRGEVGAAEFARMMQLALEYRLGRQQFENIIEGAVQSAKGRLAEDVEEMGDRV